MNRPIKVIHKYKNNNRMIQYNVLIFVGNLIKKNVNKILIKIKNKSLFESLTELNDNELTILITEYGEYWYKYFFIDKHIKYTIENIIKKNEQNKKEIIKKYNIEWYNLHIDNYTYISKIFYGYNTLFKKENEQKQKNKKNTLLENNIENENYKINNTYNNSNLIKRNNNHYNNDFQGENDNDEELNYDYLEDNILEEDENNNLLSLEELENITDDVIYDKKVDDINKFIINIIDNTEKSNINNITKWDNSKDNNSYDELLKTVYIKTYIYNQYISIDDSIKKIKNKICCGYEKSTKINKESPYFIPSRLYLWSEYSYYDNLNKLIEDKIMLGNKWIMKNELLNIDVEPFNNIRVYENLKGNLKNLQDNLKKYGSRIIYQNDEYIILLDYINYITNNEIYMIDLYNELGINYNQPENIIKNIYDIYIKIYFIGVTYDEFNNVLDYLNKKNTIESNKINLIYKNLNNDLLVDNEILNTIEELKKKPYLYNNIFKNNYVIQSVINVQIKHTNYINMQKIDLYRIFNNFIMEINYPFIQYQTPEGKYIFKYYINEISNDRNTIISKWFENSPYGISFKILPDNNNNENKYISVSLNENGRIDYKIQWKEENKATIDDIYLSYDIIRSLLVKINKENNKLKLEIPDNNKFTFAFINTIQQFELPEKFKISHNDLSDFARYFYPYIAVMVEPRKRQSKILKKNEKSKYGTYLRYKRISNYENEINIEKRILYFLKNYESNEKQLNIEISKLFNINEKQAYDNINRVIQKYPNLKKSRNILKKYETIIKYKHAGIGIDIVGKERNNYKIRINGVRSKQQLDEIIHFMNILIYLYIETFLYKKPERQELKNKLKLLTNIPRIRNKVIDFVEKNEDISNIKIITKIDKERLAYKPEKGQNQWSRNCQNSGKDKIRRPFPYTNENIQDMINSGYIYNSKTEEYERIVKVKGKEVTLIAAKINNFDNQGNSIYYTCNPEENGEYMHIGFLSRSVNPYGLCMPCCFKKNQAISVNKEKKEFYLKCLGKLSTKISSKIITENLYILQNTNKINDNRFANLPDYIDIYLNILLNNTKLIKNSYFIESNTGWFFKYGTKQEDDVFFTIISDALQISVQYIKDQISNTLLKQDNAEAIFTSLNNGEIKLLFKTIDAYIRYIYTNYEISYSIVADILSIPGVIYEYGINCIIFDKTNDINKNDYNILFNNNENLYYLLDKNKANIIIIKEEENYYPIYNIKKTNNDKNIFVNKIFKYNNDDNNIIKHLFSFMKLNYTHINIDNINIYNAKELFINIEQYGLNEYYPTSQIIDKKNRCIFLIIQNKYIIPVKSSGCLFWINIENNINKYINDIFITSDIIYNLYISSKRNIQIKPKGIVFSKNDNNNYTIDAIIIDYNIYIPIIQIILNTDDIIKYAKKYKIKNIIIESQLIYNIIDKSIENYDENNIIIDQRITDVNENKYKIEAYNLFRLEISYFLNNNEKIKNKLLKIINKDNDYLYKKNEIQKILYFNISDYLYDIFIKNLDIINNISTDINGGNPKIISKKLLFIDDSKLDLSKYIINNNRDISKILDKKSCINNYHYKWNKGCFLKLSTVYIIEFVSKITEEFIENKLKARELLNKEGYIVSDIVNKDFYSKRDNQQIIKSKTNNIKKILSKLFGKYNIPIIGKRQLRKSLNNIDDNNLYQLEYLGDKMYQQININNGLYRVYTNCFYWLKNSLLNVEYRNLGYYSILQTELANFFKSKVIDWILEINNQNILINEFNSIINLKDINIIDEFKSYLAKINASLYSNIIDLYILNQIYNIPIILYNNYDNIIGIIDNGIKYLLNYIDSNINTYIDFNQYINIKYNIINFTLTNVSISLSAIYF